MREHTLMFTIYDKNANIKFGLARPSGGDGSAIYKVSTFALTVNNFNYLTIFFNIEPIQTSPNFVNIFKLYTLKVSASFSNLVGHYWFSVGLSNVSFSW